MVGTLPTLFSLSSLSGLALSLGDLIVVGFWEQVAPEDDEERRARGEPEQTPPTVRRGWYESAVEDGGKKVANGVTLLE